MLKRIKELLADAEGIAVIEYVLLLSLVVIGVFVALNWTGLLTKLQSIITALIAAL